MSENFSAQEILDRARMQRIEKTVDIDEATIQLVVINIGTDFFAMPGPSIREILPPMAVTFVPGLPDHFLGIINVRGDLESVIDLAKTLHLSHTPGPLSRVMIAKAGELSSGFLVDYVHDIIDLPKSKITPGQKIPAGLKSEYITGEFEFKSKTVLVLDVHTILNDAIGKPS
ncbi:chemotaxis protein CheW [bacterium]|nr:chemotaxis protein CheW [bacterium]